MASSTTAIRIQNAGTAKRQFVLNPRNRPVTKESKQLIDRLLLERKSIAAIGRVSGISPTWMQNYASRKIQHRSYDKLQLAEKTKDT